MEGPSAASDLAENLLQRLQWAADRAAEEAATLIPPGATVVTCSYSSAVLRTIQRAKGRDVPLAVMVLDGGGGAGSPARHLASDLKSMGVDVRLFDAADLADAIGQAELVLVGADAVTADFILSPNPRKDGLGDSP